jgi:hypothetical protein
MAQNERSDVSRNKSDAPKAKPGAQSQGDSSEELRRQIAEAAYYRAQERGFSPGYEEKDWLEAEAQVMKRPGVQGKRSAADALTESGELDKGKLKENQARLDVGPDHKTPDMKKGHRGTFP